MLSRSLIPGKVREDTPRNPSLEALRAPRNGDPLLLQTPKLSVTEPSKHPTVEPFHFCDCKVLMFQKELLMEGHSPTCKSGKK